MGKGSGGVRGKTDVTAVPARLVVKTVSGNDVLVRVKDEKQRQALLEVLQEVTLPDNVKGIVDQDAQGFGGLWANGLIIIERPDREAEATLGEGFDLMKKYKHTFIHEIGHAWYDQVKFEQMYAPSSIIPDPPSIFTIVGDSLRGATTSFKLNYDAHFGGGIAYFYKPHRLDNATEWFAEGFTSWMGAVHPKTGAAYYRPPEDMDWVFKRVAKLGHMTRPDRRPNTKVGPWEDAWTGPWEDNPEQ